jgi:hypothetical protein
VQAYLSLPVSLFPDMSATVVTELATYASTVVKEQLV